MLTDNNDKEQERRAHPRHLAKVRVQLLRSDTIPMQLRTVSLSMGGMHIECDQSQAQLLAPPDKGEGQQFTARMMVSTAEEKPRALTLKVAVISSNQQGEDEYRVGLSFVEFFGKSREMLSDFIAKIEN